MKYDGSVTIQTSIEEKGIDKGIENISNKLEKLRKKAEEPYEINGAKVTGGWNLTDKEQKYYDRLSASLQQLEVKRTGLLEVEKQITQETQKQKNVIEQQNSVIDNQTSKNNSNKQKIFELASNLEEMLKTYNAMQNQDIVSSQDVKDAKELRKEILEVKKEYEKLTGTKLHIKGITDTKKDFIDIEKSLTNTIKKVGRWTLAIFGIRTAYSLVQSAMSTLSQYDEQLAINVEYIRYLLATTLQPVIEYLVNLVYRLLTYVNYVAQAWFGVNLFANASTKAFENNNRALKDSVKNAKELNKQILGFDEMNVLKENGNVASGGGGGGVSNTMPNFPTIENVPIPEWLTWIVENGELVRSIIELIALAIAGLVGGLAGFIALGIVLHLTRIWELISSILTFIQDPSWENFYKILENVVNVIFGPLGSAINWVVDAVVKNWDEIIKTLGGIADWIYKNVIVPIGRVIDKFISAKKGVFNAFVSVIKASFTTISSFLLNPFKTAAKKIEGIFNGLKTFFSGFIEVISSLFTVDLKGVLDGFLIMFQGIADSLWTIVKAPINLIIGGINAIIKGLNKISIDIPDWVPGLGGKKWGFNIKTIPKLAVGGIVNMPGRGVYYGGANIAERGPEGVIPLTNSQMMTELGKAIGQYVTINANITNNMNGRVISRELQKINSESIFATNS